MPMAARLHAKGLLLTAVVACGATTLVLAAPAIKPAAQPDELPASPAIDPAKLADSATLRAEAARNLTASHKNLQAIAIAFHNYAGTVGGKLPGDVLGKDGKPLLSWRVRILPYLQEETTKEFLAPPPRPGKGPEEALFKQFKLNEPWNSKHNLALVEKMPRVFASPRVSVKRKGYTVYQLFTGPDAVFHAGKPRFGIGTVPDGTSNTILAVEASTAVPWTKPADLPFAKDKALPDFGKAYQGKPLAAMLDGSARVLDLKKISAQTLKNAIMPADGNVLGADWNE
jgi:hypothetical protein